MKSLMNKKGFTLIELMIVIAIIGVLAAIAIPNFIAYRDKSYCSQTESNARTVASAIAEYYSIASRTTVPPDRTSLKIGDLTLRDTLTTLSTLHNTTTDSAIIVIKVEDPTTRCPMDYRKANDRWSSSSSIYRLIMQ